MKIKHSLKINIILYMTFGFLLSSCGPNNLFSMFASESDKEKANTYILSGDYDNAINTLSSYISSHPNDTQAIGMLATAYMLKANLNLIEVGASISQGSGANTFQSILAAMPNGTQANIDSLTNAVNTLATIPAAQRTAEQNFQYAFATSSLAMVIVKKDCLNSSGNIDTTLTNAMSDADANLAYNNLSSALTAFSSAGISAGNSSGSANVADLKNQIDASAGASTPIKFRAFIISKQ